MLATAYTYKVRTPINPLEGLKLDWHGVRARRFTVRTPINPLEGLKHAITERAQHCGHVRTPINPLEGLKLGHLALFPLAEDL